jgi:hypothetical protein
VLYADVEYFGEICLEELVDGVWFFEDMYGGVYSFVAQRRVNPTKSTRTGETASSK